ncbi:RING finger protein ETP1-like isoform X2 [Rosa rugosa]|uniref:RING finger protein ETP1-like isoform X2 n=1 Tax=Rosa rugosa TaxID=74645 RepID=UPI002B40BDA8|nr:RING finger protein ETP1-like isoform X2 [Rosa rugosa]
MIQMRMRTGFLGCWLNLEVEVCSERQENPIVEDDLHLLYGAELGWVDACTSCDHLPSLSSDLVHIPTPDTNCNRCQHPSENWLCLCCKEVLCSRFVNKHMLQHYQQINHCVALSYRQ